MPSKKTQKKSEYEVTPTGRLTINDFARLTGAKPGDFFILERPRRGSKAWRVIPAPQ